MTMRYIDYSRMELEDKATDLLVKFDRERLKKIKPIDVYAVIEKCLNVPYDWKYLSPDQSILGATAFDSGYIWVWPENKYYDGLKPFKLEVEKGTILIEATLTEQDNRGRENFTVMHEVFHHVLHKRCFKDMGKNFVHTTYSRTIDGKINCSDFGLKQIEYQANACAAAFLMPAKLTIAEYKRRYEEAGFESIAYGFKWRLIRGMAKDFGVSKQAMSIRLQTLGLIDENEDNLLK